MSDDVRLSAVEDITCPTCSGLKPEHVTKAYTFLAYIRTIKWSFMQVRLHRLTPGKEHPMYTLAAFSEASL